MGYPDEHYLRLALGLARRAEGRTRPNPMVGAVLVRAGRIVGTGFHAAAGRPHAEVIAIRRAGRKARGATLYLNLEPCAHHGRTPPCVEAIRAAGIRRVVAAMIDPNPFVRGRGLRRLKAGGISTKVGVLEQEARALNEVFVTWKTAGRPFVTVKAAQSLDGKIATRTGASRWISSPPARAWTHHLRSRVDAILVGVETVLKDDPRLTARSRGTAKQPLRIVLDSKLRTPAKARLFSQRDPILIATLQTAPKDRERRLVRAGAQVLRLPGEKGRVSLKALLRYLARKEVTHLLIEGGGEVIASALAARAVDRLAILVAPILVGGRQAPTLMEGEGIGSLAQAIRLEDLTVRRLGPDLLVQAAVRFKKD